MRRLFPLLLLLLIACGPFFYQAPPSIGNYPERIAAKRWQALAREAELAEPVLPEPPQNAASSTPAQRLAEIDYELAVNRRGLYSARRANFLHEQRELAPDDALFAAAKTYLEWRANHDAVPLAGPPAEKPWDMKDDEFYRLRQNYRFEHKRRLTFLKEQIAKADSLMMPYWKVRRASILFDAADYRHAETDFSEVVRDFPDHPRAEAARLMLARCNIEQSRVLRRAVSTGENVARIDSLLSDAEGLLTGFIDRYPKGRFTPDAEGWLGAIAFDRGFLGLAVNHQLARLDLQPTREITRTVLRECDYIFGKLLDSKNHIDSEPWLNPEDDIDAAAVARHPLVARLFVQHCIDPAAHISLPMWWDDGYSGDRGTIDFLKRRILVPKPFVNLALNELGKQLLMANSKPDATTLTLLAWVATEEGEHEQALALLDQIQPAASSDEALHARSIILQRLTRHADVVAVLDDLAAKFPASPLTADLPFRRSVSLLKSGRSGVAISGMLDLVFPEPPVVGETPRLHPHRELLQWLDTMIQFAPLDQLESAFTAAEGKPRQRDLLRDAIRSRALAVRRFDLAETYLSENEEAPAAEWEWFHSVLAKNRRMTAADWETRAAPLASLYARLVENPPASEAAKLHLFIARHWMAQRGSLTLPLLSLCYYAASEQEKQDQLRRRNALELGFSREVIHQELDLRDEASQALKHALEAAKSTDPAIAAPALELANQCLFRRAEFSLYQKSRALETNASALSADLDRQLRERFPDTPEAGRSVFFTFTPAAGEWMPGDYNAWHSAEAMAEVLFGNFEDADPQIDGLPARFGNLPATTPLPDVRRDLQAAVRELATLRPLTDPIHQTDVLAVIDRLDDLQAAASLPDITTADFLNYVHGENDKLPPAFESLLDFRERLKPLPPVNGWDQGPRNDTIDGWSAFLESWPKSPKAEAASFRLTRLIARKYRTSRRIEAFQFPEAPIPNGYKRVKVLRTNPANDPAEVLAAIAHHQAAYPNGRYRDDLNLLRAGALIDAGQFPEAVALLEDILANPAQRDLHVVAALEFADVAQCLLDPEPRAAAAKAIRQTPGAIGHLRLLVDGDTFLSRLKPLMPWLEAGV